MCGGGREGEQKATGEERNEEGWGGATLLPNEGSALVELKMDVEGRSNQGFFFTSFMVIELL